MDRPAFHVDTAARATVLVVGAGAVGNEAVKNLALLGVGRLLVFDRDRVEAGNLPTSALFRRGDVGALKAAAAARAARALNPEVDAAWRAGDVERDLGLGVLRRAGAVVGGLDNRLARIALNRMCRRARVPWVDAGIGLLNGQVSVFHPSRGACYECALSGDDYAQILAPCGRLASRYAEAAKVATTPAIASIVAGVQAQEALKLLEPGAWEGRSLEGREFVYNGAAAAAAVVALPVRPGCPAHAPPDASKLVELPEARAGSTTAGGLLAMAGGRLAPGGGAELVLNFELAVLATCRGCRRERAVRRPVRALFAEDLQCDACGGEEYLETTHALGGRPSDLAPGVMDDLLATPLADLGVPPLDVLEARAPGGASVFLELTGDADARLGFAPAEAATSE